MSVPAVEISQRERDAELVAAIRRRDQQAIERFVREVGGSLIGLCRSLTGSEHDAEDALQEALVKALTMLDSPANAESLTPWVRRIATNAAVQKVRERCRRRERPIETLLPAFHEDGHRVGPEPCWVPAEMSRLDRDEVRAKVRGGHRDASRVVSRCHHAARPCRI